MSGLPVPIDDLPVYGETGAYPDKVFPPYSPTPTQPPTLYGANGGRIDLDAVIRDGADPGVRNSAINSIAFRSFARGLPRNEVWALVLATNAKLRPPLPMSEVEATFLSAERGAAAKSPNSPVGLFERFEAGRTAAARYLQTESPPREELVEDLLPKGVPVLLVAGGGTGKGYLLFDLALALATGTRFGPFNVPRPCKVLSISLEDSADEQHRRLRAAAKARWGEVAGHALADAVGERLRLVDLVGVSGAVLGEPLVEAVAAYADGCEAIFLDPLGKMLPPGVELNSQEGAGEVHRWLDRIVRATGATVIEAHHATKAALAGGQMSAEAATGSRMLVDLARAVLTLRILDEEEIRALGLPSRSSYVQLGLPKSNYTPGLRAPVIFRRVDGGALEYAHADRATDRNRDLALKALCIEPHRWVTREEWRDRFQHLGGRYRDFDRARQGLIDDPNELAESREIPGRRGGRAKRFFAPAERLRTANDWPLSPEENPTQSVAKQSDAASNENPPSNQARERQGELLANDSMQAQSDAVESTARHQRETNRLQALSLREGRSMQSNAPPPCSRQESATPWPAPKPVPPEAESRQLAAGIVRKIVEHHLPPGTPRSMDAMPADDRFADAIEAEVERHRVELVERLGVDDASERMRDLVEDAVALEAIVEAAQTAVEGPK